ncbi:major facilitator superfamily domain-containing protein [Aspergillus avenaceus]|uniref:Major facilitator superfamily domain-containing protein n=1 Tax=Aspergillus avenaceus TaxID=36643 RepID=A0A5N6U2X4_ASPAV|nr:major facilitator superfamily domain-containing protein [Aspergillus avenaceus]
MVQMCIVFLFQYLDKQSLSYASVFGLIEDLALQGSEYSWCTSMLYIGQLLAEYPFIYLMSRLPLPKFVGTTIILWGIVCMCLAVPNTFAGFATVRFLLGFTEGAVSPAFVTLTSLWYTRSEHVNRMGALVTMSGLAQVFGSLLMYGTGKMNSRLAPWRVMFLICGALTCGVGFLFCLIVPSDPSKAWFLNRRERLVLVRRMALSREGGDRTNFSLVQMKEAIRDSKAWSVFVFGIMLTMPSPVVIFASLMIKNLNYDAFQTMLFTAPSGAVQIVFVWIGMLLCALLPKNRCIVVMILSIPPLVGNILLLKLPLSASWAMIVSSWLASCLTGMMTIFLSLSASNVKGNTKRAIVNSYYFIGHSAGCIAAPQLWTSHAAPRYFEGVVAAVVSLCLLNVVIGFYWYLCYSENRERDRDALPAPDEIQGSIDITDKQDRLFRYSY